MDKYLFVIMTRTYVHTLSINNTDCDCDCGSGNVNAYDSELCTVYSVQANNVTVLWFTISIIVVVIIIYEN